MTASTPASAGPAIDWAGRVAIPESESPTRLYNGRDLSGWHGHLGKHWVAAENCICGFNTGPVSVSTYLFTKKAYRNFRLLFEVKQTKSARCAPTMHSGVAILGERISDQEEAYGFKGLLLMFCGDWGIWDAHRRNRVYPPRQPQSIMWRHPSEKLGNWNRIELLIIGNRIRMVNNGHLVIDYLEQREDLFAAPIGFQLHSHTAPQKYLFRGLVLTENPENRLVTVERAQNDCYDPMA
ncbi:MAG TPA: DUF1080 domain-containing protein [Patescibacteria group bacterium]|nr:DUF1080 domain-containing protein [Patescibacteria group bacterium]